VRDGNVKSKGSGFNKGSWFKNKTWGKFNVKNTLKIGSRIQFEEIHLIPLGKGGNRSEFGLKIPNRVGQRLRKSSPSLSVWCCRLDRFRFMRFVERVGSVSWKPIQIEEGKNNLVLEIWWEDRVLVFTLVTFRIIKLCI